MLMGVVVAVALVVAVVIVSFGMFCIHTDNFDFRYDRVIVMKHGTRSHLDEL